MIQEGSGGGEAGGGEAADIQATNWEDGGGGWLSGGGLEFPLRVACGFPTVFLDSLLNLGMGNRQDVFHHVLKSLPRFRALDHLRLTFHRIVSFSALK